MTYVLFVLGALFALIGIYLIFVRKSDEKSASLELFGVKLQASSAGTLVFLIGAALLLVTFLAPNNNGVAKALPGFEQAKSLSGQPVAAEAVLLPPKAGAEEVEPNNHVSESNQFRLGNGVKGRLDRKRDDTADWYVVNTAGEGTDYVARIRSDHNGCRLIVYDHMEQEIGDGYCNGDGGQKLIPVFVKNSDKLFLKVIFNGGSSANSAGYEVFLDKKT